AGSLIATLVEILLDAIECVTGAADRADHASGHLLELRLGLQHLGLGDEALEFLNLLSGLANRDLTRLEQILVSLLGVLELAAVLLQLLLKGLELQGILSRQLAVAGLEVGSRFGGQLAFLRLLLLGPAHDSLPARSLR